MKKFLNEPKHFVDEMLEGILLAHPDQLSFAAGDHRCIVRAAAPKKGKVGIATPSSPPAQNRCST
jgi:phosphoenolpyruvate---glycerone phosphotransferase subunit DhaK